MNGARRRSMASLTGLDERVVWAVLLGALSACSGKAASHAGSGGIGAYGGSPESSGSTGGPGGAAGGQPASGAGGGGPLDAAVATGGQAPPSDAASDIAQAALEDQACRDSIAALCQRRYECGLDGSPACPDAVALCPRIYFGPRSRRTAEAVAACSEVMRHAPCTDVRSGLATSCLPGGVGEAGAPCSSSSECASRSCSGNWSCGTCAAALPLGAACGSGTSGSCVSGTICHPNSHVCVSAPLALAHAKLGEPCDPAGNPPVGCEGDLACFADAMVSVSTAGVCTALPKQDEPCLNWSGPQCGPGMECGRSTTGGTRKALCGSPPPCGTVTCDPATTVCIEAPKVPLNCRPYVTEGQACSSGGAPEGDNICARDLICMIGTVVDAGVFNYYRGTCVRPGSRGDACGDMAPCKGYLRCQGGVCADFDPDSCGGPTDAGTDG